MFNVSFFSRWTTHSSWRYHWPMAWSMKCCDSLPHSVTFHNSQCSGATHFRCGGIFNDSIRPIANCLLILTVKQFWKSVNICIFCSLYIVRCAATLYCGKIKITILIKLRRTKRASFGPPCVYSVQGGTAMIDSPTDANRLLYRLVPEWLTRLSCSMYDLQATADVRRLSRHNHVDRSSVAANSSETQTVVNRQ